MDDYSSDLDGKKSTPGRHSGSRHSGNSPDEKAKIQAAAKSSKGLNHGNLMKVKRQESTVKEQAQPPQT